MYRFCAKSMARPGVLLTLGAAVLIGCSTADQREKDRKTDKPVDTAKLVAKPDDVFIRGAWMSGMTEVEAGKLAQSQGADPRVRAFGARMIEDHGRSNEALKALAAKRALGLPTDLDPTHMGTVAQLRELRGAEFDKQYMSVMVRDHTEDGSEFQRELKDGQDKDTKDFAQRYLEMVQEHLTQAKEMAAVGAK